jgi:uncharacterized protein
VRRAATYDKTATPPVTDQSILAPVDSKIFVGQHQKHAASIAMATLAAILVCLCKGDAMNQLSSQGRPRFVARRWPVHGRGLFANAPISAVDFICEYKGTRVAWSDVLRRLPDGQTNPGHTFFFDLEGGIVIDGNRDGNSARWLNHCCSPNSEAELSGDRIFIYALRDISAGEELTIDYALVVDGRISHEVREQYRCYCLSSHCRGTMLEKRCRNTRTQPATRFEPEKTVAEHRPAHEATASPSI